MLKEAPSILARDRRDRLPQRLDQRLAGARPRPTQKDLDLGESFLPLSVLSRHICWMTPAGPSMA